MDAASVRLILPLPGFPDLGGAGPGLDFLMLSLLFSPGLLFLVLQHHQHEVSA